MISPFPALVLGFLLISILFSAISTNFQPLLGHGNSENGQSKKICSAVYNAATKNANNKIYDECLRAETYSVKGSSLEELLDQSSEKLKDKVGVDVKDKTGIDASAVTRWSITGDLKIKDGLVDESSTIQVDKTIIIPSCDSGCTLSPAAQTEWERYIGVVLEHEIGHVDRVEQYSDGLLDKVVGKNADEAEEVIEDVINALREEQEKYEIQTGYGQKQGAILDISIE